MNGISHKQAIKLIHGRLDGLLKESQVLSLEQHLRSCDSCRLYAAEMDLLPTRLQNEFHARWDEKPGPSQTVIEHVTRKARNIPMTNRISSGVKLFAGVATLVVLALLVNFVISQLRSTSVSGTETAPDSNGTPASSFGSENRLLAFTSEQNGNLDIYTMRPDGSGLTNLSNNPAYDGSPFWSPDGKRIAFESDRDGSGQIYLMDADGSNVIQLTNGEGNYWFDVNGYTPWSPDGRKLIFSHEHKLYVMDITDKNTITLTNEPGQYLLPSWSPDGRYIAFISDTGRIPRDLFVVGSDGNHLTKLTENLSGSEFFLFDYDWSQDGTSIAFATNRNQQVFQDATYVSTVYEANVDGSMTVIHGTNDRQIIAWWNGITVQQGETYLSWLRPDGSQSTLDLCPLNSHLLGIAHKRSYGGNLVFGSNCSASGWRLYWTNTDGTIVNELLSSPIPTKVNTDHITNMAWSSDDRYLAFVASYTDSNYDVTETLYILDVVESRKNPSVQPLKITNGWHPSWQPVINNDIAKEEPTPEPTQISSYSGLIAFTAANENGNFDIYTMRPDGSELTNLTNNPAHDTNPIWSPDGKHIAFESNRNGFMQIYLLDADGSNVVQLTNDKADHSLPLNIDGKSNPWSPDGSKLLFLQRSSGGEIGNLYLRGINSENKVMLSSGRFSLNNISWSSNGKYIGYILNDSPNPNETFATGIYVVDSNGNNPQELKKLIPQNENLGSPYYWSSDGQSIVFIAGKNDGLGQTVYEFDLETNTLLQRDILKQRVIDWQDEISLIMERSAFVWQRSDGTRNTLDWDDPNCLLDVTRSLHGNFAIGAYCPDSKNFKLYWANSDGSTIKQLLDSSTLIGQLWDIAWSPDDQYIAFNIISDKTSMYILNVEDALRDSSIQPIQMVIGEGELYTIPSWQPAP